ncbi:MAG: acyl-CoA thioesterase [candidate division WOR-3 bacterium]
MEKVSIGKTKSEYIRVVFPEHANSIGSLYGGYMMRWILDAGTLLATKFTKGPCVIGSMDSIDFIKPVKIGDILLFESFVEYVGNTSIEIGVNVFSGRYDKEELACISNLSFVALDSEGNKRIIDRKVYPENEEEEKIYKMAIERRERRKKRILELKNNPPEFNTLETKWSITAHRVIFPEDTLFLKRAYGGKVLMVMDELAAILARKYAKGICVTASVDEMDFLAPAYIGEILNMEAYITSVFNTSLEILVKVFAENPEKGEFRHVVSSYMVFVHLDEKGNLKKLPEYEIQKILEGAIFRKKIRDERRKKIKEVRSKKE